MPGITLHEEVAAILGESGREWMTTTEIANEVNARGWYHKRDGSPVSPFQIHGRTQRVRHCSSGMARAYACGKRAFRHCSAMLGHQLLHSLLPRYRCGTQ